MNYERKPASKREPSACFCTLAAAVRLPTRDPFATLEPPVVRIRQNHLHEHVVVRRQVESSDVKAEEGEHPPASATDGVILHGTAGLNRSPIGRTSARVRAVSPALLGDDHLRLVAVELEPQRPVAEVDLGPHPRARRGQSHAAESRPRPGVGRVDAAGALPELVSRAELISSGCWGRKPRGGQHGAQVER